MLDALRQTRASVASPVVVEEAPLEAQRTPNPPAAGSTPALGATPAVELPRMVADAVAMYAFGDPIEAAANYQRAVALHKAGRKPADIVREIRQGANPEAFI